MTKTPHEIVAEYAGKDERVLWAGRPRQGIVFVHHDLWVIPLGIAAMGFGAFVIFRILSHNEDGSVGSGIPLILIGLYLSFARLLGDAGLRKRTVYGLTDKRIVIVTGLALRVVKAWNLRQVADIRWSQGTGGIGTVSFRCPGWLSDYWDCRTSAGITGFYVPGIEYVLPWGFEMIDDARKIYDLIIAAQGRCAPRASQPAPIPQTGPEENQRRGEVDASESVAAHAADPVPVGNTIPEPPVFGSKDLEGQKQR